jgi:hypothetical protein
MPPIKPGRRQEEQNGSSNNVYMTNKSVLQCINILLFSLRYLCIAIVCRNDENPNFKKHFIVDYHFEQEQGNKHTETDEIDIDKHI